MIRKWLLVSGLILFVGVVWRVWQFRMTAARLEDGSEHTVAIHLVVPPKTNWAGVVVNNQGLTWVCPKSKAECNSVAQLQVGDQVIFTGRIQMRQGKAEGLISHIKKETHLVPAATTYWWWVRLLGQAQNQIDQYYRLTIGEPYAGLLSGIVLGTNNRMDNDLYESLVRTGTMHVVAASGFNISLVAGAVMGLTVWRFKRRVAVGVTLAGIAGYVLLAGGGPAVVRAGIMGGLAVLAQLVGRSYYAGWALLVSVVVMLFVSPWLLGSVSFQLSVAATAGLVWGSGRIQGLIKLKKAPGIIRTLIESLSTTLAAILVTLPISLVVFGQVSMVAPLVNVLILWLVPPMMVIGGLGAMLATIYFPLGQLVIWLAWPLLFGFVQVIRWGGDIPWALVTFSGLSWIWGVGWWCLLASWWFGGRRRGV